MVFDGQGSQYRRDCFSLLCRDRNDRITLETETDGDDSEPGGYKGYDQSAIYFKTGARHYDPNTGTFMTPDPFKGYMTDPSSQHPYMYCKGNPIAFSDPSGYADCWVVTNQIHTTIVVSEGGKYSVYGYGSGGYAKDHKFDKGNLFNPENSVFLLNLPHESYYNIDYYINLIGSSPTFSKQNYSKPSNNCMFFAYVVLWPYLHNYLPEDSGNSCSNPDDFMEFMIELSDDPSSGLKECAPDEEYPWRMKGW